MIATFEDRARSGASHHRRDGLAQLLKQANRRQFDVVIVKSLDRLSRDIADLATIHKRLEFLGIELRAVHEGLADTVVVALRGLVGQLYCEDGAKKSAAAWQALSVMDVMQEVGPTAIALPRIAPAS